MKPRGHVSKAPGIVPWRWVVSHHNQALAWGEEFTQEAALNECFDATTGARIWLTYSRRGLC